jgi:hypothetical protein
MHRQGLVYQDMLEIKGIELKMRDENDESDDVNPERGLREDAMWEKKDADYE